MPENQITKKPINAPITRYVTKRAASRRFEKINIFTRKISVISLVVFFTGCISVESVDQPYTIKAGERFMATVHIKIHCIKDTHNSRLVFAFLVPKLWKSSKNITLAYNSNIGSGRMIPMNDKNIPSGSGYTWAKALYYEIGTDANVIDDLEWLVFVSDKCYSIKKGAPDISGTVRLSTIAGKQNLIAKLGYFAGIDNNGLGNKVSYFTNPVQVINGSSPTINFCKSQSVIVTPLSAYPGNPITITFDANYRANALSTAQSVYLSSKAYTTDNICFAQSSNDIASMLRPLGNNRWALTLSPASFYHLSKNQRIKRIEFFFTGKDGDKIVGDGSNSKPYIYSYSSHE